MKYPPLFCKRMSLYDQAKQDLADITGNQDEFGKVLKFVSRVGAVEAIINGLHARHHTAWNEQGEETNTITAHCSFSEQFLVDKSYPVRNAAGDVDMKGDIVYADDSAGINRKYKIQQVHPTETIGYIRCKLSDCK